MIQAYIGDGKGKTTAALGLVMRASGAGWKIKVIFFDKGGSSYAYHERRSLERLGVECVVTGCDRQISPGAFRLKNSEQDIAEARRGLEEARRSMVQGYRLLVLDEVLSAVSCGLLRPADLADLLAVVPPEVECVVTGRVKEMAWLEPCHLISRIEKERHYFDAGQPAREGIEY